MKTDDMFREVYKDRFEFKNQILNDILLKKPRKRYFRKPILLIACIILFIGIGFGSMYAYALESDYKEASKYFTTLDIDLSDYTKRDVIKMYKDITKKTYSYEKTTELIETILVKSEIVIPENITSDELENLWSEYEIKIQNDTLNSEQHLDNWNIYIGENKITVKDKSILCLEDKEKNLIWELNLSKSDKFPIKISHIFVDETITVFCDQERNPNNKDYEISIASVDKNGQLLWLKSHKLDSYYSISSVIKTDDNYLVKLYEIRNDIKLISVSKNGELSKETTLSKDGKNYLVKNLLYHDGRIYLSCDLLDIEADKYLNMMDELYNEYIVFEKEIDQTAHNRVTEFINNYYTACMIVCDENLNILKISETKGSYNARYGEIVPENFIIIDNMIIQHVIKIENAIYDPYRSAGTIFADIIKYEIKYNFEGEVISQSATEANKEYVDAEFIYSIKSKVK